MPTASLGLPGRYAEQDAAQLADAVERSYERDELPDWELVFELSGRMLAAETSDTRQGPVATSRPG